MQTRHALQIALVWQDRLLESRAFGPLDPDAVTIGEPLSSDFVIPMGDGAPQVTLFRRHILHIRDRGGIPRREAARGSDRRRTATRSAS